MQTISTIQTTTLTHEIAIRELQETYTVLSEHNINVSKTTKKKIVKKIKFLFHLIANSIVIFCI